MKDSTRYKEYLKSDKWANISRERLKIDNYKCQSCGTMGTTSNPLQCHHLSYTYLYHEEQRIYQDLVTLCKSCHNATHRMMNRITSKNGRHGWSDRTDLPILYTAFIGDDCILGEVKS